MPSPFLIYHFLRGALVARVSAVRCSGFKAPAGASALHCLNPAACADGAGLAFFRKEKARFDAVHQKAWVFVLQQHLRVLLGRNHQRGARKLLLPRRAVYFQLAKVPCIYSAVQPEAPVSFSRLLQAQHPHPQLRAAIRDGRSAKKTTALGSVLAASITACMARWLRASPRC